MGLIHINASLQVKISNDVFNVSLFTFIYMVSIHIDATMQVSIAKYFSLYLDYMYVCLLIRFTPTKIHQGLPPINSQKHREWETFIFAQYILISHSLIVCMNTILCNPGRLCHATNSLKGENSLPIATISCIETNPFFMEPIAPRIEITQW